ncbi:MAG: OB-fold domain-containing protein [Spirochaetaceae bacterium]|nr:OB-fold domain-containing protein [Myxococcales bacterium]MCB9725002.1 OB-fold domain-containing protein [Spirochaetaceae bacterium]HPG27536.1 OB-fold domain-containing protein [Myxococcota bacterium]
MRIEQPYAENGRPVPRRTPTSAPWLDAAREGRLRIQRCPRDGFFYYPRNRCPVCLGADWAWEDVSGRGTLYSWTVDRVGHDPAQRSQVPLVVAIVELEEGPRLTSRIVGCAPEDVSIGMPLEVCFEDLGRETLVHFKPRGR